MTTRWWERLIYKVSETGSISHLLRLHPVQTEDSLFTRPMIPFDCVKIGGCGHGTKRVPTKSCAINSATNFTTYNYYWEQNLKWPEGWPIKGHKLYGKVNPTDWIDPPETDESTAASPPPASASASAPPPPLPPPSVGISVAEGDEGERKSPRKRKESPSPTPSPWVRSWWN